MGGNFPGGNFTVGGGGDSPAGSLIGGNFPVGSFPNTVFMKWNRHLIGQMV